MRRQQLEFSKEQADRIRRRLDHDNGVVPELILDTLTIKGGGLFIKLSQLLDWLSLMGDKVMSDQKQEVYRGLREYLNACRS